MAMADIARYGDGKAMSMAQIAERQQISLPYLEQLFSKLRQSKLVKSMRGPGGGYILARPAEEIFVGEIMQAVGEPVKMTRCESDDGVGCLNGEDCITHSLWSALSDHIYAFLGSVTLKDVIDKKTAPFGTLASRLPVSDEPAQAGSLRTGTS
jgi:Rrf2 family iron-sulfur cluster assembly transcriptional regulator